MNNPFVKPNDGRTESDERRDDGHRQRGNEQVDDTRQEGNFPGARVSQPDDVCMSVMQLDVSVDAGVSRERTADLSRRTTAHDQRLPGKHPLTTSDLLKPS